MWRRPAPRSAQPERNTSFNHYGALELEGIRSVAARLVLPAPSDTQVSAKSGFFFHVKPDSGTAPRLTVLESVRCLECDLVYAKPTGGGTVQANPGCPDCGYVGWVGARSNAFTESWLPRHSDEGRQPRPHD